MGAGKIKILLVDDSTDLLESARLLFGTFGFNVDTAENGQLALALLEKNEYDVVLSDIRMPVMDGLTLLKKIRERDFRKPLVLMISGYTDSPVDDIFAFGAGGFFSKPFSAASIKDAIRRASISDSERWKLPALSEPALELKRTFKDFADLTSSTDLRLGRGGFFFAESAPRGRPGDIVGFNFECENGVGLSGSGVLRWLNSGASAGRRKGYGVEINSLSSGNGALSVWIEANKPISYIPKD